VELRQFQKEAFSALKNPGHVICVAPTGSGKSLIYEYAAKKSFRKTLLITPLVALARQQAERLLSHNVPIALGAGGGHLGLPQFPQQESRAWIVSPELLLTNSAKSWLRHWRPNLVVVDECHCLWEWGEGFRPAFARIPELITKLEVDRSLWLTATLPLKARTALRNLLPMPVVEIGDFDLPENLSLTCLRVPWSVRLDFLLQWLQSHSSPGIIFAVARNTTERLARLASATGRSVLSYHAGMSKEERLAAEKMINARAVDVVIATSAFGMGMNYEHFEWSLIWQAPPSLLSLAQSIGRVGRGNKKGRAVSLWDYDDFHLLEWINCASPRRKQDLEDVLLFFEKKGCRRQALISYFDERLAPACQNKCDYCLQRSEGFNRHCEPDETGP
jgi:ATP-dependent DNA helicase RecQ